MEAHNGLRGARAFRAAVHSVLSPANRQYMAEQSRRADRLAHERNKKKLVIGGKTFSIDEDDLSVVADDEPKILPPAAAVPKPAKLHKRDSSMSMVSSCSIESDWSDEELEELEKMLQHKSSLVGERSAGDHHRGDSPAPEKQGLSKWRSQFKKSQKMAKLQRGAGQRLDHASVSSSSIASGILFTYWKLKKR